MNVDEARRVLGALDNGDEWRDVHDTAVAVLGLRADNYRARPEGMEGAEHWSKAWRGRVTEAADLRRAITPAHPMVPVAKLPSAWREGAEGFASEHAYPLDRERWQAKAETLQACADELAQALTEEALGDAGLTLTAVAGQLDYWAQGEHEDDPRVQLAAALLADAAGAGAVDTGVVEHLLTWYADAAANELGVSETSVNGGAVVLLVRGGIDR